ncbi:MAG: aminoacetone oxidase family FAD-binding enzyme [Elusimicrobiaceae bacterium]|nr:aminoacetone oxidase family FAD-binding enzyme [Elusimicrobiaceae bacterium]
MKNQRQEIWHTIIIGAGASGLFCAGSFSAQKLVLEHNDRAGKKLSVTGGGKCNFTNLFVSAQDYVSDNKHFCKSALSAFPPQRFIDLLQEEKIPFYEKEEGQLFSHSAPEVVRFLLKRAQAQNTTFSYQTQVLSIQKEKDFFRVQTTKGLFYAYHIVMACGGVSYPALGSGNFAFQTAQALHLTVEPLRPALVGFKAPAPWKEIFASLAGNSLPVEIKTKKHTEKGQLLFTHEGISGPAVMQTSLFYHEGEKVFLNFLPEINLEEKLRENKNAPFLFSKILANYIPAKISKVLLQDLDVRSCEAKRETLFAVIKRLQNFEFIPSGTMGYTRAEVTAGGVSCAQFSPQTMECKTISGLFYIGEALDVTGRLGGFNLHWAWASAHLCAEALKKK